MLVGANKAHHGTLRAWSEGLPPLGEKLKLLFCICLLYLLEHFHFNTLYTTYSRYPRPVHTLGSNSRSRPLRLLYQRIPWSRRRNTMKFLAWMSPQRQSRSKKHTTRRLGSAILTRIRCAAAKPPSTHSTTSHPQQNDPQAAAKFQQLGQAYQILADEEKRKLYDQHGKAGVSDVPVMDPGAWSIPLSTSNHHMVVHRRALWYAFWQRPV